MQTPRNHMQGHIHAPTRNDSFASTQKGHKYHRPKTAQDLIEHTSVTMSASSTNSSAHKKQTKLCLLCLALLLTEDNHFVDCLALLFGTLCVSMSVFVRMHTACHSWSLATPPTARPAASCHHRVPTHSLTVWPKCLGNQNRPESWVSSGQLPLPVIWVFTHLFIWSILCLFICLLFSAYTYLFL